LILGGSGFIAAFAGGIAAVTWIGFGAVAFTLAIPHITWQVILYAVLSLTLVRMIPVAIAFAGRGVRRPTVAFIGWFGPRGLASLVFALLALERGVPDGEVVLATVVVTVALSVVLHGLTLVPLVAAYHRWYEVPTAGHPAAEETMPE
jgi:NhaP-type Na+/H+ or K+/H+ antiporter